MNRNNKNTKMLSQCHARMTISFLQNINIFGHLGLLGSEKLLSGD